VTHTSGTVRQGESLKVGEYQVKYLGLASGQEPHRTYVATKVEVTAPNGTVSELAPRMNYYERMTDPIGTPAVRTTAKEDLYLSLMAFSQERGTASFNAWVFPLVGWIWWSIPVLVLGTLIALWPARRSRAVAEAKTPAAGAPPSAGDEMNRGAA
jgi:cytochrome c-type biogenesis protein CcmF